MLIDIFEHQRGHQPKYVLETFFGQLQHIIRVSFENGCRDLGIDLGTTILLVAIRTCVLEKNYYTEGLDLHPYSRLGALHIVDVKNVQCLVGRIFNGKQWTILDRSGTLACAVYYIDGE
jgi:hypothetical protein